MIVSCVSCVVADSFVACIPSFSDLSNDEYRQRFYLGKYSPGVMKPRGRADGSSFSWTSAAEASTRNLLRADKEGEGDHEDDVAYDAEDDEADEATVVDVPDYKNWKEDGAVTPVKNQWFCGA